MWESILSTDSLPLTSGEKEKNFYLYVRTTSRQCFFEDRKALVKVGGFDAAFAIISISVAERFQITNNVPCSGLYLRIKMVNNQTVLTVVYIV